MKYVVFSFDDARLDTYTVSIPILEQHGMKCVINVISDFVEHPESYKKEIKPCESMTVDMIIDSLKRGHEIAGHGHRHRNTVDDIQKNIEKMSEWGVQEKRIGFASPFSSLTENEVNNADFARVSSKLRYVRSGTQTRRAGVVYAALWVLQELLHSPRLFYLLNRKKVYHIPLSKYFLEGVSITHRTSVEQLRYLINKMPDNCAVVLIYHSVTQDGAEVKQNKWVWDSRKLSQLCEWISDNPSVTVKTNMGLYDMDD